MIRTRVIRRLYVLIALLLLSAAGWGSAEAQSGVRLRVRPAPAEQGFEPRVEAEGLLRDGALRDALESGLPLRFRLRVELWGDRLFDRLVSTEETAFALTQDPLDGTLVLTLSGGELRLPTLADAQRAVSRQLAVQIRPSGRGRYYYLARLEVETLSLSDLEELRRWLRGEVGPAVEGRGSAGGAVESGLRRVLIRVIGLPTRRLEGRSESFVVP